MSWFVAYRVSIRESANVLSLLTQSTNDLCWKIIHSLWHLKHCCHRKMRRNAVSLAKTNAFAVTNQNKHKETKRREKNVPISKSQKRNTDNDQNAIHSAALWKKDKKTLLYFDRSLFRLFLSSSINVSLRSMAISWCGDRCCVCVHSSWSSIVVYNEYITWLSICIFLVAFDRQFELWKQAILPICLHSFHYFFVRFFLTYTWKPSNLWSSLLRLQEKQKKYVSFFFRVCILFSMHSVFLLYVVIDGSVHHLNACQICLLLEPCALCTLT